MTRQCIAFPRCGGVLALASAVIVVAGCAGGGADRPPSALGIHLARTEITPGFVAVRVHGESEPIYANPDAVITGLDVKDVQVLKVRSVWNNPTDKALRYAVAITFTRSGARRLARAIDEWKGKDVIGQHPALVNNEFIGFATPEGGTKPMPGLTIGRLAFFVNGKLVVAPSFKGKIGRKMLIGSEFTEPEAGRLAAILAAQTGPSPAPVTQTAIRPTAEEEPAADEEPTFKRQPPAQKGGMRPSGSTRRPPPSFRYRTRRRRR